MYYIIFSVFFSFGSTILRQSLTTKDMYEQYFF